MAVCPIMSFAQSRVECGSENCALWDKQYDCCSLKSTGERVGDGFESLVRALNEIKGRF